MNWIDEGFLISKNRYSENSLIAELYTKDYGKVSGIIFGGTSKKIKNYSQLIKFVADRPGHDFRYAIDSSKIRKQLKWLPKENFESGIKKTIKWYLKNNN